MGKSLSQITFDFAAVEEASNTVAVAPAIVEEKETVVVNEPVIVAPVAEPKMAITKDKPASTRGRRSLKDIGINADLIQIPEDDILVSKTILFYR